jgi:hypothetical protein
MQSFEGPVIGEGGGERKMETVNKNEMKGEGEGEKRKNKSG